MNADMWYDLPIRIRRSRRVLGTSRQMNASRQPLFAAKAAEPLEMGLQALDDVRFHSRICTPGRESGRFFAMSRVIVVPDSGTNPCLNARDMNSRVSSGLSFSSSMMVEISCLRASAI